MAKWNQYIGWGVAGILGLVVVIQWQTARPVEGSSAVNPDSALSSKTTGDRDRPTAGDLSSDYLKIEGRHNAIVRENLPQVAAAEDALGSKEALRKWISWADSSLESRLRIDKAGMEAQLRASEKGDYTLFAWLVEVAPGRDVAPAIASYLSDVTSRLGLEHDLNEKLKIADTVGEKDKALSSLARIQILNDAGTKVNSRDDVAHLQKLPLADLQGIMLACVKEKGIGTLEFVQEIDDPAISGPVQSAVVEAALARDSTSVVDYIEKQEPGPRKDRIIGTMVTWLIASKDSESASAWVDQIADERLKGELKAKIKSGPSPVSKSR